MQSPKYQFKTLHSYKPATLFTLLWIVSISLALFAATAADLARYDYKKAVNGKLLIYKYFGVNAADRVRVGELWLAEVFSENFGVRPKAFYKMFYKCIKKWVSKQMPILMAPAKL